MQKSRQRRNEESGAALIRSLTRTAIIAADRPLTLYEVYKSIVSRRICNFNIHWAFFLCSLCSRMEESGIVIFDDKVDVVR